MIKSRKGKKWIKKEEEIIREYYNKIPHKELAELLKRDVKSIQYKAYKLKVTNNNLWSDEELKFLIENYKDIEYKKIGKIINKTQKAVTTKVWRLGLENKKDDFWSEVEIDWLKKIYNDSKGIRNLNLDNIGKKLRRNKHNICRKAKSLGLTDDNRILTKEQCEIISNNTKIYLKENGHPKGMLGKHHTEEVKQKFSNIMKKRWESWEVTEKQRKAWSENGKKLAKKMMESGNMYSRTKSGERQDLNNQFFRSSWEANYARYLNHNGIKWEFEPKQFIFKDEIKGTKTYTPDFYLPEQDKWIEVKGWLDSNSKSKLKKFKKYYPEEFKKLILLVDKDDEYKEKSIVKKLKKIGIINFIFYKEIEIFKHKILNWEGYVPGELKKEREEKENGEKV